MPEDSIGVECKDLIGIITINNPEKKNAVNNEMLIRIGQSLEQMEADGFRAIIIRGTGDRMFCSGYDVSAFPKVADSILGRGNEKDRPDYVRLTARKFEEITVPVIAMINGHCMGAGLDMAGACDLRYAASGVKFQIPPARLGITYNPEGVMRLINTVGVGRAKELLYLAQDVTAEKAYEMGFLNRVLPREELESFTMSVARNIAENAPLAIRGMKKIFKYCLEHQKITEERDLEAAQIFQGLIQSKDAAEALLSFLEKRKPVFKGR
jgi:enoyl-CoA hydratase/carnithine racemase